MRNSETLVVGANTPCKAIVERLVAMEDEDTKADRILYGTIFVCAVALLLSLCLVVHCRKRLRSKSFTTFVSHSKQDGGDTAAFLKREFDKVLLRPCFMRCCSARGNNFLDVEELAEISADKLVESVKMSRVLVLLLTKSLLTRPWCLVEIYTALVSNIPIVPVLLKLSNKPGDEYCFTKARRMLEDLQNFLCDEQKMQNTWGQPAWSGSEIDDCRVQTTTAQELRLMDPIKVSHTVVTPAGGLLTLADIQRELSKSLGSKKAETYNAQAAEVLEYSCRICLHEHVTHQI
jgi:hypothetical protein